MRWAVAMGCVALWLISSDLSTCCAGLSASQVVVVVNADSLASRTLANHYVRLRDIPPANVIVLHSIPNSEKITVDQFRTSILIPLLQELEKRSLSNHVECIAYSADFPTAIEVTEDLRALEPLPQIITPIASINSLTYFYRWVLRKDPSYVALDANFYARRPIGAIFANPGGKLTESRWREIEDLIQRKDHRAAKERILELRKEYPFQYPLAYLAASQAALSGDDKEAMDLLNAAVGDGWDNSAYLKADPRFETCRSDPRMESLLLAMDPSESVHQPAIAFRAQRFWAPNGIVAKDEQSGMAYVLSIVLGVTRGGGTTLEQAVEAVKRSSLADFSQPPGAFYFCTSEDVRTKTRRPNFDSAITELKKLGFQAEIVEGILPQGKPLVMGACIGAAGFDWNSSKSSFLPGAIAENLTSLGGVMESAGGQTKLTELIKAGCAGSSGTVTEPYAVQPKFPHPLLYAHYAQGASLVEAFYLNVTGPYQLLIVGDPLCQPFANPPDMGVGREVRRVKPGGAMSLEIEDRSKSAPTLSGLGMGAYKKSPLAPANIAASIDSQPAQWAPFESSIRLTLTGEEPRGAHEFRLAIVGEGLLEIRREQNISFSIGEHDLVQFDIPGAASLKSDRVLTATLSGVIEGADRVEVVHESEVVAEFGKGAKQVEIPMDKLGMGPVRLHARAWFGKEPVRSHALDTFIKP